MTAIAPAGVYAAQVLALLEAVDVRPPETLLWFGRRDPGGGGGALVDRLADRLEREFFSAGGPLPPGRRPVTPPDDGGEFVRALSQANGGRGAWQAGWRLGETGADEDGVGVVGPDGLRLIAPPEDCRVEGSAVSVRLPKELRGWRPGAVIALGDTPAPAGERVALYWNIAAAGAVTLVARLTYALNGAGLAFRLELPDNPARFARRDSAVLTVARPDLAAAVKLSRPLLRTLGAHLAEGAPALTKPLARGLAVAEQPRDGRRFGAQRCRLVAEALVAAAERGLGGSEQRLAAVSDHFSGAGLSLAAPYLEPGSADADLP